MNIIFALALITADLGEPNSEQSRTVVVSNVTYTIRYELKSTAFANIPLTNPPGQPHYDCTATVYAGTNKLGVVDTQWTQSGCFEDSPIMLLGRVLNWTRYPNDSAGKGFHWRIRGGAMFTESDEKQ